MGLSCNFPLKQSIDCWENFLASLLAGHWSQDVAGVWKTLRWSEAGLVISTGGLWHRYCQVHGACHQRLSTADDCGISLVHWWVAICPGPVLFDFAPGLFCQDLIYRKSHWEWCKISRLLFAILQYWHHCGCICHWEQPFPLTLGRHPKRRALLVLRDFPARQTHRVGDEPKNAAGWSWRSSHLPDKATQSAGYNMDPMSTVDMLILRSPVRYWVNPQVG